MKLTEQQTRDFIAGAAPAQYLTTEAAIPACGVPERVSMHVFHPLSKTGITVSQTPSGWYYGGTRKVYKTLNGVRSAINKFNRWN